MNSGVDEYADLRWAKSVNSARTGYNSFVSPRADVGEGVYAEVSYVHSFATAALTPSFHISIFVMKRFQSG